MKSLFYVVNFVREDRRDLRLLREFLGSGNGALDSPRWVSTESSCGGVLGLQSGEPSH